MSQERKIGNWVSDDVREQLEGLRHDLEERREEKERYLEKKERQREEQKRKSRKRRWKNLRGAFGINYSHDGVLAEARFWWDPKLKRDIVEIPLSGSGEADQERFIKAAQTAEGKQGWRSWTVTVEEEGGVLRIVCEYRSLIKYPRTTDPKTRATLIFAHLGISPLEIEKVPKPEIMVKSEN